MNDTTAKMREVESYVASNGEEVSLHTDGSRWEVTNWGVDGEDWRWSVSGVNEGGREENGRIIGATFVPFDETAARKEFERWRK